jgi:hypothetical protein
MVGSICGRNFILITSHRLRPPWCKASHSPRRRSQEGVDPGWWPPGLGEPSVPEAPEEKVGGL